MKKLFAAILLIGLLLSANVSYGKDDVYNEGGTGGSAVSSATAEIGDISVEGSTNSAVVGDIINNNANNSNATNHGNSVSIIDVNPSQLLSPNMVAPLYKTQYDDVTLTTSIFKLHRSEYTVAELTRFANPGRFLAVLWPEWDNTYQVEIATFVKEKPVKQIYVGPASDFIGIRWTKIGEAHAFSKSLHKSEHQVMAAMAVKAAEAGARLVVFRGFSNPVTKVDSMVIGGGGAQTASSTSVFNGATGIGFSTGEKLSRAYVVAELYR